MDVNETPCGLGKSLKVDYTAVWIIGGIFLVVSLIASIKIWG